MIADLFVFTSPLQYAAQLKTGELVRYGALLKDAGTGKIVAHLQETGLAHRLLGHAGLGSFTPWGAVSGVANLASNMAQNVQLRHLTQMVQTLSSLQYATLGAVGVGIGLSAVSFWTLSRSLKKNAERLDRLAERVEQRFDALNQRHWREHFAVIDALLARSARAASLSPASAVREWLEIDRQLDPEGAYLRSTVAAMLAEQPFDLEWFEKLVSTVLLSDSARLQCLLEANELEFARSTAVDIAQNYQRLFDSISVAQLADCMVKADRSSDDGLSMFARKRHVAQDVVNGLRQVTMGALSKPLVIDHLMDHRISGNRYLAEVRAYDKEPLIALPLGT